MGTTDDPAHDADPRRHRRGARRRSARSTSTAGAGSAAPARSSDAGSCGHGLDEGDAARADRASCAATSRTRCQPSPETSAQRAHGDGVEARALTTPRRRRAAARVATRLALARRGALALRGRDRSRARRRRATATDRGRRLLLRPAPRHPARERDVRPRARPAGGGIRERAPRRGAARARRSAIRRRSARRSASIRTARCRRIRRSAPAGTPTGCISRACSIEPDPTLLLDAGGARCGAGCRRRRCCGSTGRPGGTRSLRPRPRAELRPSRGGVRGCRPSHFRHEVGTDTAPVRGHRVLMDDPRLGDDGLASRQGEPGDAHQPVPLRGLRPAGSRSRSGARRRARRSRSSSMR